MHRRGLLFAAVVSLLPFALAAWLVRVPLWSGVNLLFAQFFGSLACTWFVWWFWCRELAIPAESRPATADVREDANRLKALAKAFDPEPFICLGKGIFLGLDGNRRPIYLPREVLDKNHMDIVGVSGTGKSSLVGLLLAQLAEAGETVVVFDPKFDRMLPGVLVRRGERVGYPVWLIDLRAGQSAQINPLAGATPDQVDECLQAALQLQPTGDAGVDFYRGEDREASFLASRLADNLPALVTAAAQVPQITERANFWRELQALARVEALHAGDGAPSLSDALAKPGVIYIVGSTTDLRVAAAQRLILQRIMQLLDERENQSRPVCVFEDELKYLLSPGALRAAGTVRDRNCHLIFAHQSIGDLHDCPGLQPRAVVGAVWGNTSIKIAYKVEEVATAQELSAAAGVERVWKENVGKNVKTIGAKEEGGWAEGEAPRMPVHLFTHLPKPAGGEASVGVLFGLGPAQLVATRWLESAPAPKPVPAPAPAGVAIQTAEDLI